MGGRGLVPLATHATRRSSEEISHQNEFFFLKASAKAIILYKGVPSLFINGTFWYVIQHRCRTKLSY